jgi:hypothetical protein
VDQLLLHGSPAGMVAWPLAADGGERGVCVVLRLKVFHSNLVHSNSTRDNNSYNHDYDNIDDTINN